MRPRNSPARIKWINNRSRCQTETPIEPRHAEHKEEGEEGKKFI